MSTRTMAPVSDRRQFLVGGTILAAAAAATALSPKRLLAAPPEGLLERAIPNQIGPYRYVTASGLVVPPQDELSERIYDAVLTRVYSAGPTGPGIMLLIAYGSAQDAGLQVHRPEVCYPAAGYAIRETGYEPLTGVPGAEATYLSVERGDRSEQVYYWTRIGNTFPKDQWTEKLAIFNANVRGGMPDGVLVRVSVLSPSRTESLAPVATFNTALLASLGRDGRRLLLGQA
ncbi:exosortase-associated protein EpsI, V-type [Sphingomonas sp.]|uniref:exosortase-associated protein EpsI, V-type n=1 Tax=Sphingomonas sp. TaxID=28214 RepID=UPI002ED85E30